ncbi:MAG: hypothetical protein QM820_44795 [Minicystis sp.]
MDIAVTALVLITIALGAALTILLIVPTRNAALGAWSFARRGRRPRTEPASGPTVKR